MAALELPEDLAAPGVELHVRGRVARVEIELAVAQAQRDRVAHVPAHAGRVRPRGARVGVRVVERRADVAPPRIPPAAGARRAADDVRIDIDPTGADFHERW